MHLAHAHTPQMKDDVDLSFLAVASSTSSAPIRDNALHLSGGALAHLPTAQVFSYVTRYTAAPVGVEWINDTALVVLFPGPHEAYDALIRLAAGRFAPFAPTHDTPLEARQARPVPSALLPRAEDADPDVMDEADMDADAGPNSLTVRYAKTDDMKARKQASSSRFYQRYGRHAGKEVAPPVLDDDRGEQYEPVAREDAVELLGGEDDDRRGAGFRADAEDESQRTDLLQGSRRSRSPRTKRPAMDLLDEEAGRPAPKTSLLDRLERPRDRRELSPDRKGGMRGWDEADDGAPPDRSWRDEPRVPVLEERVGEYAERRYDERRERSGRSGRTAREGREGGREQRAPGRTPREAPKKKTAEDLDRELSEYLGR